jgi:hypothetical protein
MFTVIDGKEIRVPQEEGEVIIQNLNGIDMDKVSILVGAWTQDQLDELEDRYQEDALNGQPDNGGLIFYATENQLSDLSLDSLEPIARGDELDEWADPTEGWFFMSFVDYS